MQWTTFEKANILHLQADYHMHGSHGQEKPATHFPLGGLRSVPKQKLQNVVGQAHLGWCKRQEDRGDCDEVGGAQPSESIHWAYGPIPGVGLLGAPCILGHVQRRAQSRTKKPRCWHQTACQDGHALLLMQLWGFAQCCKTRALLSLEVEIQNKMPTLQECVKGWGGGREMVRKSPSGNP